MVHRIGYRAGGNSIIIITLFTPTRVYGILCIDDEYLPNPNYDFIICIIFLVLSARLLLIVAWRSKRED